MRTPFRSAARHRRERVFATERVLPRCRWRPILHYARAFSDWSEFGKCFASFCFVAFSNRKTATGSRWDIVPLARLVATWSRCGAHSQASLNGTASLFLKTL